MAMCGVKGDCSGSHSQPFLKVDDASVTRVSVAGPSAILGSVAQHTRVPGRLALDLKPTLSSCTCRLTGHHFLLPPSLYSPRSLPRPLPTTFHHIHLRPHINIPGHPRNMPSQGYERVRRPSSSDASCDCATPDHDGYTDSLVKVAAQDEDDSPRTSQPGQQWPPASPPPSFRSRASSPNGTSRLLSEDPIRNDEDHTLADTFDSDSEDEEDSDGRDDRQRLMRGNPSTEDEPVAPGLQRRVTELPAFDTQAPSTGRVYGGGNGGVWASLSAKPTRGEDAEEKPPVRTS
jgi:hypothetical protein